MTDFIQKVEEEFAAKLKCINSSCDQRGSIPHQIADDEWEAEQCQFCFEYRFPLQDFIRKTLLEHEKLIREQVADETKAALAIINSIKDTVKEAADAIENGRAAITPKKEGKCCHLCFYQHVIASPKPRCKNTHCPCHLKSDDKTT